MTDEKGSALFSGPQSWLPCVPTSGDACLWRGVGLSFPNVGASELSSEGKGQLACTGPAISEPVKDRVCSAQHGFRDSCANAGHEHHLRLQLPQGHGPRHCPWSSLNQAPPQPRAAQAPRIHMALAAKWPPGHMVPGGWSDPSIHKALGGNWSHGHHIRP